MIITTPALAAAQRLRESCQVRTHERNYTAPVDHSHNNPNPERTERLRRSIRPLLEEGLTTRAIADKLHIAHSTVTRHATAIREGR